MQDVTRLPAPLLRGAPSAPHRAFPWGPAFAMWEQRVQCFWSRVSSSLLPAAFGRWREASPVSSRGSVFRSLPSSAFGIQSSYTSPLYMH